MSARAPLRRLEECLSDFAIDELVAARSLHVDPAPASAAHVATCSRCAQRLAEFEAVEPPPLTAAAAAVRRKPRFVARAYAALAGSLLVGGIGVLWSREPHAVAPLAINDIVTRTKGTLSLIVISRDLSGNIRRLTPTDVAHPGESLRFELTAAQPGYAGIVGLDAAGVATVYAPAHGSLARLAAPGPVVLPDTIVMDETLGVERLVAVLCNEPLTVPALQIAGEAALQAKGGDPTRVSRLQVPCAQATADLHKQAAP